MARMGTVTAEPLAGAGAGDAAGEAGVSPAGPVGVRTVSCSEMGGGYDTYAR